MPRKIFKKYMPDQHKLRAHPSLRWLGDHLHNPNLWHLTRKSVSRAFLVGIFCAFLPIPGQMLVAAVLALLMASNLAVSIGLVWLTNPLTMPPIFYFTYRIGAWLLDTHIRDRINFHWDLASLQTEIAAIWWPLLLGSVLTGVVLALLSYVCIQWFWIWHVNHHWKKRKPGRFRQKNDQAD
ncbi:MAG: DUF2062 domain-containing protein [Oceanospirillales bacterium]|nr:DUF2062 domain-containing protein [Oceanospirillales bacterium]